jgi:hypothetical protein
MLVRLTDPNGRLVLLETTNIVAVRPYSDDRSIIETTAARGTSRTILVLGSVDEIAKLLSRRTPSAVFQASVRRHPKRPHLVVHEGGGGGSAAPKGGDDNGTS